MLRLLLTNDDGISAPGLMALARRLAERAEVTVIAPDTPRSACSHSITLHKPLRLYPVSPPDSIATKGGLKLYECSGTPADCVTLGLLHLLLAAPPDFAISGINSGPNLAEDLIYSGTVAGAVEAQINGVPAMAVSLIDDKAANWDRAAEVTELLLSALLYGGYAPWQGGVALELTNQMSLDETWHLGPADSSRFEPGQYLAQSKGRKSAAPIEGGVAVCPCFNVNIPTTGPGNLKGVRWTELGTRRYENVVAEVADPRGKPYYWIWGDRVVPPQPPHADIQAVAEGYISVTPIRGDLMDSQDWPHYRALLGATSDKAGESQ